MRIAILTSGRFHVCDLARELDALGHDVSFYSCVPTSRLQKFGLPARCSKSLFPYLAPLFMLMRKTQNTFLHECIETLFLESLDALASRLVGACDVFIGMSGMSTKTAVAVRRKYGAQIWIERGSCHILKQKQIMDELSRLSASVRQVSERTAKRETADYELADMIVVPSRHVERSFLECGIASEKIFRNPYGVDLAMFSTAVRRSNDVPTVAMVGTWSYRKGCDILWAACQAAQSWRLLHIGPIGDAPLPSSPLFTHQDSVPQWQLPRNIVKADVLALASREEGLSLVQAQALACGLPVVCSDRTGGEDLREALGDKNWVTVVPHDNVTMLACAIEDALLFSRSNVGTDPIGTARDWLSWAGYGRRYSAELGKRAPEAPDGH